MIKNRAVALTVIILVYILAGFLGTFAYNYFSSSGGFGMSAGVGLNLSWQLSLFLADVVATILVFIFSLIFRNASVYDPYWSVQPPVILAVALAKMEDGGNNLLAWLLFAAVLFWALRLTANWAYNFKSFEYQDWRYVMLKEKSGILYPLVNFFGIHLFPTIVVYLCVLPAVTAIYNKTDLNPLSIIFIGLSFCATVLHARSACKSLQGDRLQDQRQDWRKGEHWRKRKGKLFATRPHQKPCKGRTERDHR